MPILRDCTVKLATRTAAMAVYKDYTTPTLLAATRYLRNYLGLPLETSFEIGLQD